MDLNATLFSSNSCRIGYGTNAMENLNNVSTQAKNALQVEQMGDFRILKIFCYCIILLGSSFGNSLVVYIIASNIRMRTPSNILILNLAVCDFITPMVSIPFDFVLQEYNYVWMFGLITCKILWPLTTMTSTSAALTLAAISLDRYRTIMHPFKSRLTMAKIKFIIAGIYVFPLLMVTPYSYMLTVDGHQCLEKWPDFSHKQYYTLGLCMVRYFLPLIFMVVMYTLALKNLYTTTDKTRSGKTQKEKAAVNNSQKVKEATSPEPLRKVSSTVRLVRKLSSTVRRGTNEANKQATKMFIAIVLVFTVCMFPNQALWLWSDFSSAGESKWFSKAVVICWLFTYSNSVCNPVIYVAFSRDFRRGFKRVLRRLFCCRRHKLSRGLNSHLVATLTSELKGAAVNTEQRKRKTEEDKQPQLYIL